ncbi:hypothetical protein JCM9279_003423 [Rhodotorula babjevae]
MAQPRRRTSPLRAPCILVLVPLALALLVAWPALALMTLVPVVGLVSFPTLLSCTASLFFVLPATLHVLFAQPKSPNPPLLPRLRLLSPLANLRLLHWALLVLHDAYAASLVALALETLTKRVLLVGGRDAHSVIRENVPYAEGPDGAGALRLDVYLPQPRRARRADEREDDQGGAAPRSERAPVVVLLPSPSYRLLALSRTFPSPLIAHRLARLGPTGALVVVPALSGAAGGRGTAGIERAVGETRAALEWVAEHAAAYGADAERCTVLGYGAGAHVGMLTLVQSAVVCAREALLGAADDDEEKREQEEEEGEGGSARAGCSAQLSVDDGATSSHGGTPRWREQSSSADRASTLLSHQAPDLHSSSPGTSQAASDSDAPSSPTRPTRRSASPSPSSSSRSSSSLDHNAAATSSNVSTRRLAPLTARDIPSGVRACGLWTLEPSSGAGADVVNDEPEYHGEALASFALPRRRGGGRLRVQGVVLVGGTYDVVKQGRWLEGWGAAEVSSLARFCQDDERDILQACPSHLIYAASPLLARTPSSSTSPSSTSAAAAPPLSSLLPPRFLLIHGGRDPLVPFSQATLLRNLLVGIGVSEARLRLCRDEGGLGALATLMHPTRYSPLVMREIEHVIFDPLDADADAEVEVEEGGRGSRTSSATRSRRARRAT